MVLNTNYSRKADEIYNHFGFSKQLAKAQEEGLELSLALQKYINNPNKTTLEEVKGEVADWFVMCEQLERNSPLNCKRFFDDVAHAVNSVMERMSLKHTYIAIMDLYRKDIRLIAEEKIDRTLERMGSGYYEN
jgi:hypothetical protein